MNSRVRLVPLSVDHIDDVMSWVNDPDVIKNFQNFGKKITREEELGFLQKLIDSDSDCVFSLYSSQTGEYLGQGGINQISWANKLGRLSIFITPAQSGKGYAQSAIAEILAHAFEVLELNKVWLMVYATNDKGQHLYSKLGFSQEGLLREEYYWNGVFHDIMRMGILRSEWRK